MAGRRWVASVGVVAVGVLSAISAAPKSTAGPTTAAAATPRQHRVAGVSTHPPFGEIVVAGGTSIRVFAPGAHGNVAPVRTISGTNTGLEGGFGATAVDLDAAGNIW